MVRLLLPVLALTALLRPQASAPPTKPTQDELLAAELSAPFLQKAPWHIDWDAARAAAAEQHKLVFGYFTTVNH